jgi:ribosomal protein L32
VKLAALALVIVVAIACAKEYISPEIVVECPRQVDSHLNALYASLLSERDRLKESLQRASQKLSEANSDVEGLRERLNYCEQNRPEHWCPSCGGSDE